jgi:hypothetical protein
MRSIFAAAALALIAGTAQAQTPAPKAPPRLPSADANNDGKITLAEFKAGRVARELRGDRNRDGKVDAAERKQVMAMAASFGGQRGQRLQNRWQDSDADKDGAVTRAEVEAAAARRFAVLDANKDGVLSGQEMPAFGQGRTGGPARRG